MVTYHTAESLVEEPTFEEVAKAISRLKISKYVGSDSISAECLKQEEKLFIAISTLSYSGFERKRKHQAVGKSVLSCPYTKTVTNYSARTIVEYLR